MRKNKLEPTNLGPYEVIRQERLIGCHPMEESIQGARSFLVDNFVWAQICRLELVLAHAYRSRVPAGVEILNLRLHLLTKLQSLLPLPLTHILATGLYTGTHGICGSTSS